MRNPLKLKRAVIKEELVALTGDYITAILLQQLLYWGERVNDFDAFILEENKLRDENEKIPMLHGWIYKDSRELSEETMLNLSVQTIRRYLTELVTKGFVSERTNPKDKWDRTLQYRPNIRYISEELARLGFPLDGYSNLQIETSNFQNGTTKSQNGDSQHAESPYFFEGNSPENAPEITTEITINTSANPIADSAKQASGEIEFGTPEPAPKRTPEEAKASIAAAMSNPDIGTRAAVADGRGEERANRELLAAGIAVACGYAAANRDCYAATKKLLADMPRWKTGAKVSVIDISEYLILLGQQEKKLGSPYFVPSGIRDYFAKRKPDDVKAAKGNSTAGLSTVESLTTEQIRKNQDGYISDNADYLAEWKSKRKRNKPFGPALSD